MAIDYKNSVKLECRDCGNIEKFVKVERVLFNARSGKWDKRTKRAQIFCSVCQSNVITTYAFPETDVRKI